MNRGWTDTPGGDIRPPSEMWAKFWPPALAVAVVASVGAPAAVASYRHARSVVEATGDPVMAPWLPLSVDGMLLASLVVIWVRRHRGDPAGAGPWCAFAFGLVVTILANLAAVTTPDVRSVAVALFPPIALAVSLELVALVAYRTRESSRIPHGVLTEPCRKAAETLPEPSPEPPETPSDDATDAERVQELREWAAERGTMPGRDAVKNRFGVGSSKANKLRDAAAAPAVRAV